MLDTRAFGEGLKKRGFDFFSGVPCSFLKDLINYAINECDYIPAANEGDAVAIASGVSLVGKRKGVAMMQNSGLTNATSPLTSLNYTFELPILGIVSLRGEEGVADEPQHELMGKITTALLDTMKISWEYLSSDPAESEKQLDRALEHFNKNKTFFFVVKKNTFSEQALKHTPDFKPIAKKIITDQAPADVQTSRNDALSAVVAARLPQTFIIATTGFTGRELHDLQDHAQHFYMVGSMGCASSFALGVAKASPKTQVIVIDGDGAALMRLGAFVTMAAFGTPNLFHMVLDNGAHESTGGQSTVSPGLSWTKIAEGCNYPLVYELHSGTGLSQALKEWQKNPALTFASVKIKPKAVKLGRPTVTPVQVKQRAQHYFKAL